MSSPSAILLAMAIALLVTVVAAHPADAHPADAHPADAHRCPPSCFCYHDAGRLVVKCRQLPLVLPHGTGVLVLDGVPLHHLDGHTLPDTRLAHLEAFHCVGCSLRRVHLDAFRRLTALKVIDLSDNDIVDLTADHFTDSANLRVLDLEGNERVDCATLKRDLPKAVLNCDASSDLKGHLNGQTVTSSDLKGHLKGQTVTSSDLKGQRIELEDDAPKARLRRQAEGEAVTLPAALGTPPVETATLPAERQDECISMAWKVIAIVFIVLWSVSCFCNVLKCCCDFCGSKKRTVKGPQGNSTVYQMTTTELDDRYT